MGDYEKLVIDLARDSQNFQMDRVKNLRERAYTLIQIGLVVAGIFATIISFILERKISISGNFTDGLATGIALLMSAMSIQYYLTLPRPIATFDIEAFDKRNGSKPPADRTDTLIATLFVSIDNAKGYANRNTKILAVSIGLLAVGTFVMFILSLYFAIINV
jgi:nucleosome binding factor SPN SPT16 subunit